MKNPVGWIVLMAIMTGAGCSPSREEDLRTTNVVRGSLRATLPFQGTLEARRIELISVGVQGAAVLAELVEEGTRVQPGDLLARFDSSQIEQDLARQESEYVRTQQELESLEKAELPLELLDMESKLAEGRAEIAAESQFLESARGLMERGLMSESEVAQQEARVSALNTRADQLAMRIDLTREHVHAARLAKARAALAAAGRQRDFLREQLNMCEVRAPVGGIATLVPLPIGGDWRTAHVGDTLHRNQTFLCLPDPAEHVVRGFISEGDLPWVRPGYAAEAIPAAYPHVRLGGKVETVGGMAQTRPGYPAWRRFFPIQIALEPLPEPMPVGLSTTVEILAGEVSEALLVPREAIQWHGTRAMVRRWTDRGPPEEIGIEPGLASATHVEVISGLSEGDPIILP